MSSPLGWPTFRLLNLRSLRYQPLRAVLAVIAIAASVAMSVAGVILVESLDRSIEETLDDLSGPSAMRVVGPFTRAGVDPAVVETVAGVDGVGAAVPVVTAVAIAQTERGEPVPILALGVDCRIEAVIGAFACEEQTLRSPTEGPVLTSTSLEKQAGRGADIRTDQGRVPLAGATRNDDLDGINDGRIAVFELETSQRLFDRGRNVDVVYVRPASGIAAETLKARVAAAVPGSYMVLDADEPAPWMTSRGPLIPLLAVAVLLGLGLSVVLVYNIVALSLADRRRDIAVASAVGVSPRSLTAGAVAEAALLGLFGGVSGIPAGILAAGPVVGSFASTISEQSTGLRITMHVPASAAIIGLLIGVVVGVVSAMVPAWRARRLDLAAELHGRAVTAEEAPRRSVVRIAVLLAVTALTIGLSFIAQRDGALESWQPPLGGIALLSVGIGVFAVAGAIAPFVIVAVLRFLRNRGGPLHVALANLVSRPRRTSVIATAVSAAVGMACVLGALLPSTRSTMARSELAAAAGSVSVTTLPLNNSSNIDARPSIRLERDLERVPGVAQVDGSYMQEITDREGSYSVRAFGGVAEWTFPPVAGETGIVPLERGEAVIGTSLARSRGLRPGSVLRVATPTGSVPLRVAGIWSASYDNGYTAIVSVPTYRGISTTGAPHTISVKPADGTSQEELASAIRAADLDVDAKVMTSRAAAIALADEVTKQGDPFWTLQRLMLFVALVATLSTLLLVGVQRRRELGILGAVGFGPIAVARMTVFEAVAAGLAGAGLGVIGSLAVFEVLRNAAGVSIGVRPDFSFNPMSGVSATLLATIVVIVGAALPAWRAARVPIVEAIRDE